jgi:hypothetical protein
MPAISIDANITVPWEAERPPEITKATLVKVQRAA